MRLPRDVSGADLAKALAPYGYSITRQSGSHMRLTSQGSKEHHITIPAHTSLRVGTLNAILGEVAQHLKIEKSSLISKLRF